MKKLLCVCLLLAAYVPAQSAVVIRALTATPDTVAPGEISTVAWSASGVNTCVISAAGQSASVPAVFSQDAPLYETTVITLNCAGVIRRVRVTVTEPANEPPDEPPPPDNQPPAAACGSPYTGIPDPCVHFGFNVFAAFAVDEVISGVRNGSMTINRNGTAANPYVINASQATFNVGTGSIRITGKYIVFTCGKINSTGESAFQASATFSVYRNCDIRGNNTNHSHGSAITTASNTLFHNFKVHNFGVLGANAPDQDQHGWKVKATNVWILDSQGYQLSGDGIQVGDATNGRGDNVYIGGGYYHHNRENGIDIKDSRNVVVSGVRMEGFRPSRSSPGEALIIHDEAVATKVLNSVIRDATLGIVSSGLRDHVIDRNNIQGIKADIMVRNTRPITIRNNTINDCEIQGGVTGTLQAECRED